MNNKTTPDTEIKEQEEKLKKGIDDLAERFNAWTEKISLYGIQATYAIIAANWATFGSTITIISRHLALASLICCIGLLAINLALTWWVSYLVYHRASEAKHNPIFWENEYQKRNKRNSRWPYTKFIEDLANFRRFLVMLCPIIAGCLFIGSIIFPNTKLW